MFIEEIHTCPENPPENTKMGAEFVIFHIFQIFLRISSSNTKCQWIKNVPPNSEIVTCITHSY